MTIGVKSGSSRYNAVESHDYQKQPNTGTIETNSISYTRNNLLSDSSDGSPKFSPRFIKMTSNAVNTTAGRSPPELSQVDSETTPPTTSQQLVTKTYLPPTTGIRGTIIPSECSITYQDLELIHHYSFHTDNIILMQHDHEKDIWDRVVPRVSFSYPYLSDAILAISGLHLQHCSNGTRDLRNYALQKYYNAMASSQVHDITTSFEPKFLTSCFLMMLAFSFEDILELISFDGKLDVFALCRGPYILAKRLFPFLNNGPLSALLYKIPGKDNDFDQSMELKLPAFENLVDVLIVLCQGSVKRTEVNSSFYHTPPMDNLSPEPIYDSYDSLNPNAEISYDSNASHPTIAHVTTPPNFERRDDSVSSSSSNSACGPGSRNFLTPPLDASKEDYPKHGAIYQNAIEHLNAIIKASIYFNGSPLLITWITLVSNDFMNLARRNSPFAKVIVAYYMAALYVCKGVFWIGDRPVREVYKIANSLPPEWASMMSWPLRVVQREQLTLADLLEESRWVPEYTHFKSSL